MQGKTSRELRDPVSRKQTFAAAVAVVMAKDRSNQHCWRCSGETREVAAKNHKIAAKGYKIALWWAVQKKKRATAKGKAGRP